MSLMKKRSYKFIDLELPKLKIRLWPLFTILYGTSIVVRRCGFFQRNKLRAIGCLTSLISLLVLQKSSEVISVINDDSMAKMAILKL